MEVSCVFSQSSELRAKLWGALSTLSARLGVDLSSLQFNFDGEAVDENQTCYELRLRMGAGITYTVDGVVDDDDDDGQHAAANSRGWNCHW